MNRGSAHEVKELEPGMDFRRPEYRREVFHRFYQFHLRYRSHPGGVYYLIPYLARRENMSLAHKLWFSFINGCTQHPLTSWVIWDTFPAHIDGLQTWFDEHWAQLPFDMDRRYQKKLFPQAAQRYVELLAGRGQEQFWAETIGADTPEESFRKAWKMVRKEFLGFGRLSTFSYLEYLRIAGMKIECDNLFLEDMDGSKSHRNGLAIVLGRDDLDWRSGPAPYAAGELDWLRAEGELLLLEARERAIGTPWQDDVSYFTLESTLCCYKSWHRPNRRYPNVYNDMLHDRIKGMEKRWPGRDFSMFWEARKQALPHYLRLEDSPGDVGLKPEKQNWYLNTGQVPMMMWDDPVFVNGYNQRSY